MTEENKTEIILSQWQTCVEMANSVSQRRDNMNNIFVTLNLAIMAVVSVGVETKSLFVLVAGVVLSIVWLFYIRNYRTLNEVKYKIINRIEDKLPISPYNNEWEEMCSKNHYVEGTKLEPILPITFIALYLIAIVAILISL